MIDKILSMSIKNKIDEDAITELTEHLNEYKDYYRMYIRILAVKMVKSGETKTKVAEYVHVDRRTVGLCSLLMYFFNDHHYGYQN